jgi:hypothetical protein
MATVLQWLVDVLGILPYQLFGEHPGKPKTTNLYIRGSIHNIFIFYSFNNSNHISSLLKQT